jgi:hypothetical protein
VQSPQSESSPRRLHNFNKKVIYVMEKVVSSVLFLNLPRSRVGRTHMKKLPDFLYKIYLSR